MLEVTNAYVDGLDLVLLSRGNAGIEQRRVPAEYSFFVHTADLDEGFERELRNARSVRFIRREGAEDRWTRIGWADEWARRFQINGRKDKESGRKFASPFQQRGIEVFEGDVDPVRRWFTDADGHVAKPLRGYTDIETDSRVPPRLAREGGARILSISLASEDESKQWVGLLESFDDASERKLIGEWLDRVRDWGFTQILAWAGDVFDFPAIAGRAERLGMPFDRRSLLWLDHLRMFARMNLTSSESGEEKQSMALNAIAQANLGEGKEEVPPEVAARWPGRSLGALSWELWEAGGEYRELLARYNLKDTLLMCRLERKTGFAALFDTLCDVCKVLPETKGLLPTKQMDGFMLRLGLERDFHFPTKLYKEDDEPTDPFAGAYVMEPTETGILRSVHVADFASLYPSVIISWNMSPETRTCGVGDVSANAAEGRDFAAEQVAWSPLTGVCFDTAREGILPAALKVMLSLRKEWSDKEASLPPGTPEAKEAKRRSTAYKVAANSFFGVVGAPTSRYFDHDVALSITQCAVWLIKRTIEEALKRGFDVVYGDTDSFFAKNATRVGFDDFVRRCNAELYPRILREIGVVENRIKLAYEKEFAILALIGKKRYAGRFEHYKGSDALPMPAEDMPFEKGKHSRPEIKGLEYKRGDAAVLARRLQERVILALMRGDLSPKKHRAYVQEALMHVADDELPLAEIQVMKSVTKPFAEYHGVDVNGREKPVPTHVKVAEEIVKRGGEIGEGARVSYVVVDGSDGIKAISAAEYVGEVDRYYLWEHTIYPATQRVLAECFPGENWADGLERLRPRGHGVDARQTSLFGGFDPIGDAMTRRARAKLATAEDDPRHREAVENAIMRMSEAKRWLE